MKDNEDMKQISRFPSHQSLDYHCPTGGKGALTTNPSKNMTGRENRSNLFF
jgi:hypothetical protein